MIAYHGSTEIIKNPDVVHSKKYLDFGRGFYITTFEKQARKWAVRKGMRQEKTPIVNVYELSEEWDGLRYYLLKKKMRNVCACRKGQPLNKEYVNLNSAECQNALKSTFSAPLKKIIVSNLKLELTASPDYSRQMYREVCEEYIKDLNRELDEIKDELRGDIGY